jgi:hypothetical protein
MYNTLKFFIGCNAVRITIPLLLMTLIDMDTDAARALGVLYAIIPLTGLLYKDYIGTEKGFFGGRRWWRGYYHIPSNVVALCLIYANNEFFWVPFLVDIVCANFVFIYIHYG